MSTSKRQQGVEAKAAAVLRVLQRAEGPIGPTEIARRVNEPWCGGTLTQSSAVMPYLKRIGAVRHDGGLYSAPKESA